MLLDSLVPLRRVQFCSGSTRLEGWENRDIDCDITKPLPYPDNSVDQIFIEHGFEHVTAPDGLRFLDECFRILKPRGKIRVCVPVLERLGLAHARDIILNHGHLAAYQDFYAIAHFLELAGFRKMESTARKDTDGHWRVIGEEKDDLETCRVEAVKP